MAVKVKKDLFVELVVSALSWRRPLPPPCVCWLVLYCRVFNRSSLWRSSLSMRTLVSSREYGLQLRFNWRWLTLLHWMWWRDEWIFPVRWSDWSPITIFCIWQVHILYYMIKDELLFVLKGSSLSAAQHTHWQSRVLRFPTLLLPLDWLRGTKSTRWQSPWQQAQQEPAHYPSVACCRRRSGCSTWKTWTFDDGLKCCWIK